MVLNWHGDDQRCILVHLVGLTICCLLPAMYAISRCDSVGSFSHTGKIKTLQTFKNKQSKLDELTGMINFGEFPLTSISLTSIQYVYYLYDDNKSGSSVNELRCRMFTKKNSSRDRLPSNSDALVLHLCREH